VGQLERPDQLLARAAELVGVVLADVRVHVERLEPGQVLTQALQPGTDQLVREHPARLLAERRRNRTFQAEGCSAPTALKAAWATRPLPLHAADATRRPRRWAPVRRAGSGSARPGRRAPARSCRRPARAGPGRARSRC